MKKPKIIVFTGAGVSQESGIQTFRGLKDGLWHNYKVEEVAHIDAWKKDREKVLDFYNMRKREMSGNVQPNLAHKLIAELEKDYEVVVVTQNVDNLHEMAGSTNVIHLHGRMDQKRSSLDKNLVYEWGDEDIKIGDKCEKGSQLRPNVVWFGEGLNEDFINDALWECRNADACIIIGTSMQVYPAADIPFKTKESALIWYIDPSDVNFYVPEYRRIFFYHIQEIASIGMQKVIEELKDCDF